MAFRASVTLARWTCFLLFFNLGGAGRRYEDEPVALAVHVGSQIDLPCKSLLANDLPLRINWFKDDSPMPVYSVTYASNQSFHRTNIMQGRHAAHPGWSQRAYFSVLGSPATLKVNDLAFQDTGTYVCQVVISRGTQRNATVHLVVVGPLKPPIIRDARGRTKKDIVGPYYEGDELRLTCETPGGKPTPSISWFRNGKVITNLTRTSTRGNIRSDAIISRLERSDLLSVFTCQVSNNISATVSSSVKLEMILRPLDAVVRRGDTPLSAGIPVEIVCEAMGSRPPANISWWRNGVQLDQTFNHVSADGNVTTSVVNFTPTSADNGLQLMCRAQNPLLPGAVAEDVWVMRIYYKPILSVELGPPYRNSSLVEGSDVFLECKARANPPVSDVGWRRDGGVLVPSAGPQELVVNDNFLAIQKLSRHDTGNYSCFAGNSEGVSESAWFSLRVQHAPVCKQDSAVVYVGSRGDEVQVVCEVLAHPDLVSFQWSFDGGGEGGSRAIHSGFSGDRATLSSVMRYTPLTEADFGTLFCRANNSAGHQRRPCVFHIVQAKPPEPLHNCQICNLTETSLGVTCWTGHGGAPENAPRVPAAGLNTTYVLELYSSQQPSQVLNVSSSQPVFSVRNLQPRTEYFIVLYGVNSLGHSNAVKLYASTLTSAEALLDTEHAWNVLGLGVYSSILIVVLVILCLVLLVLAIVVNRWRKKQTLRAGGHKKTCLATIDSSATVRKEAYDAADEEVSVLDIKGLPAPSSGPFGSNHDEGVSYVRETASIAGHLPCHTTDMYYTLPQLHSRHNGIRLQTFSREVM
ncbi:hemicentin-2 isoform X2 [Rhipicephalus sanguineus]|uniref:hemicentin-2 isoform X2 n=1 Tax=Rhipicephalus sanguineus TaxID=34632 RepID=UPI0020C47D5C|nr:hemicentin-2 isoform X2 [Rhipicephalus sanguineus]